MGWSLGYDINWQRDIGYGVPATCDYPGCGEKIDRGLSYVCGGEPYGQRRDGIDGCGLFFCGAHHFGSGYCERCPLEEDEKPFPPTPDVPEWIQHKLTDESWSKWRDENPAWVKANSPSEATR